MKVVCTKKNLHEGLMNTSRIIGSGNTLPVLNNILIKTDGGRIKISSTNLEMAINAWVGGKVEEEGEITVPARLVNDYVNNLPAEKITISTNKQTLNLQAEKAKTNINGLSSEEFPLIPQVKEKILAKINLLDFQKAIGEVAFAPSYSETQPEISGVLLVFDGSILTLAATDRYRLAEAKVQLVSAAPGPRQVILPTRAVNELGRISGGETLDIYLGEGQALFRTENFELITRLIEGQYPDYKQIIPTNFTTQAKMDRLQLIAALKAASLFAAENNNVQIEVNPAAKQITIKSQSAQAGDSEINLDAEPSGPQNSIIFNYRYLLECLTNLTDKEVNLKMIDESSPAAITPEGRENYLYIVMPIKI